MSSAAVLPPRAKGETGARRVTARMAPAAKPAEQGSRPSLPPATLPAAAADCSAAALLAPGGRTTHPGRRSGVLGVEPPGRGARGRDGSRAARCRRPPATSTLSLLLLRPRHSKSNRSEAKQVASDTATLDTPTSRTREAGPAGGRRMSRNGIAAEAHWQDGFFWAREGASLLAALTAARPAKGGVWDQQQGLSSPAACPRPT